MEVPAIKRTLSASDTVLQEAIEGQEPRPLKAIKRADHQAASQRHIKTEQARRDKISAGFQALQGMMPGREKVEKALLLTQAADYISQLQGVLQMLMVSGAISKLPDELQFQVRTLLPRREAARPLTAVLAPPAAENQAPNQAPMQQQQQQPQVMYQGGPAGLAPAALQMPDMGTELPGDEAALMSQIQVLLHHQQQQTAAAQQLQSWQQTIQAFQLQQVLQQQQQQQQQQGQVVVPDGMTGITVGPNPLTSLAFLPACQAASVGLSMPMPVPGQDIKTVVPAGPNSRRPGDCYADELPKCGLQQLMDAAACEPQVAGAGKQPVTPPHKARKNAVKVRRHTTAARIPKPDAPNPAARVGAGRPEPV